MAALLHDAIEDAGQDHGSLAARFGETVAAIVVACTDTEQPLAASGDKEPWIMRTTRTIQTLAHKPPESWPVIAADKAHNARDMLIDAERDPDCWSRFKAGLDGSAWYPWSLHGQLRERLPDSRSVRQLGEAVERLLSCEGVRQRLPEGMSAQEWVADYLQRPQTHPTT